MKNSWKSCYPYWRVHRVYGRSKMTSFISLSFLLKMFRNAARKPEILTNQRKKNHQRSAYANEPDFRLSTGIPVLNLVSVVPYWWQSLVLGPPQGLGRHAVTLHKATQGNCHLNKWPPGRMTTPGHLCTSLWGSRSDLSSAYFLLAYIGKI